MTTHKRQADAFDAALRGAPADEAVRELVRHAEAICATAATVTPSDDFRQALRERLMVEAADVLVATTARPSVHVPHTSGLRRRVARLSAAAVVAMGGVGIVASSASAVPGDLLYDVKRGVENVELALHRSDESRGQFQLDQARERLAEAEHLADQGDLDRSAAALEDFRSQAGAGTSDLFTAYEDQGRTETVESVNEFATETAASLTDLARLFPADATAPVQLAMDTVRSIASQASTICTACSSVSLPDLTASSNPTPHHQPSASAPAPAPVAGPTTSGTTAAPTATSAPGPSASPAPLLPTPTPSPSPAPQLPVVGPLVDGLLGEDGLVPTLLGGLLGGGTK